MVQKGSDGSFERVQEYKWTALPLPLSFPIDFLADGVCQLICKILESTATWFEMTADYAFLQHSKKGTRAVLTFCRVSHEK
jgi:hypothetical protein